MYQGKKVSVVIPAYNEEHGIPLAVRDFMIDPVDEVIVVDNNSTDNTYQVAKRLGVKVVSETKQGYGYAIRRGLDESTGDLVIITESDASFKGTDIFTLLEHVNDADLVIGTRTTTPFLHPKANMGLFLKAGNIFIAKILGILYGYTGLTDVGCTLRLVNRPTLHRIKNRMHSSGPEFSPEMIVEILKVGGTVKEVHTAYTVRLGEAKITTSKGKAFRNGLKMLWIILRKLVRT